MPARKALFPGDRLFLIAGPCVVEGDDLMFRVADHLARLAEKVPGGIIFKASFDKANRSNPDAHRGPGLEPARVVEVDVHRVRLLEAESAHHQDEGAENAHRHEDEGPDLDLDGSLLGHSCRRIKAAVRSKVHGAVGLAANELEHHAVVASPEFVGRA